MFSYSASDCALAAFRAFYECFNIYSVVEHAGFVVVVVVVVVVECL